MIESYGLTKRFGAFTAVDHLDLQVAEGEILALLGHNGAGKTTTVRMLTGLLQPTEGSARIAGYDVVTEATQVRQLIGLLTELPGLYNRMRALDYLDFFGQLHGMPPEVRAARSRDLLERFDLGGAGDKRLGEYSKGMRQKVALIRTLLHDPQVIFLDEPTSAMDPLSAKVVRDSIAALRTEHRTLVLCSHNLAEAESLADRIVIIKRGRVLAQGTGAELKRKLLGPPLYEVRLAGGIAPYLGCFDGGPVVLNGGPAPPPVLQLESIGPDWARYRAEDMTAANPALLARLLAAGAPVLTLAEVPRSLEAVYLALMADAEVATSDE
jgi:ABC-2 type transport system ATP-binding protein